MSDAIWNLVLGEGPLVAAAIHNGHDVRDEVRDLMALDRLTRLREEDPFSALWTEVAPTRVVGLRSRFEVDLNRPREKAVYHTAADAWGLEIWSSPLSEGHVARSLSHYDGFYQTMADLFTQLERQHGRFVVLDLHSYNHRRHGADQPPQSELENPQVNIGTGTMQRWRWARLIDRFTQDLSRFDFPSGKLDVRENVRFQGGHFGRWAHATFPESACVLSIEFKKFFMDEWTGVPDWPLVEAIGESLRATVPGVLEELGRL